MTDNEAPFDPPSRRELEASLAYLDSLKACGATEYTMPIDQLQRIIRAGLAAMERQEMRAANAGGERT